MNKGARKLEEVFYRSVSTCSSVDAKLTVREGKIR
jgi:hypothetical protein